MQQLDPSKRILHPEDSQLDSTALTLSDHYPTATIDQRQTDFQWLFTVTSQMRQSNNIEALIRLTVTEIHQFLRVERALIYQFETETQGTVLAEALTEGYTPSLGESLAAIAFGAKRAPDYQRPQSLNVDGVLQKTLTPHQVHLLETFQVKASLSLPIFVRDQVWGLLVVQQCAQPRQWQETEILMLSQIAAELRLSLQLLSFRSERQTVARIQEKIGQTSDIATIAQIATQEVRKFLSVEHVAICKFRPDYRGDFIAESQTGNWMRLVGQVWDDTYIRERQGGRFRDRQPFMVNQISYGKDLSDCHVEILERFEIKACAITPIFQQQRLWGALCAYQHSAARQWEEDEVKFLTQVSHQLGEAIDKADLATEKLKAEQHKQELPSIIDKISSVAYIDAACQTAVHEARQLLNIERVAVYKFRADYFGDFVYESESGGFPTLVGSAWEDTYLKEHRGGRFRNNEPYVLDDIYSGNLSDCHITTLEYFGVASFLIVAIKQGERLWGLLSAFQHSGPRHWLESEITALSNIGRQLGATLQEATYLSQLQAQSAQMTKAAQVDHAVAQIIPKILQSQDLESLFRLTSQSVRQLLKCDRVTLYRLGDGSRKLVAESVPKGYDSWETAEISEIWCKMPESPNPYQGRYPGRESWVAKNIYTVGHSAREIELLEEHDIKAYVITPIYQGDTLWGVLGAYQSGEARSWTEAEIGALSQIGVQVGAAMRQVDYLEQLQQQTEKLAKTAEQDRLVNKIVERIRQALDLQKAFQITAREIRNFLNTDRVAVFRFKSGSNYNMGQTVSEDVRPGYTSALGIEVDDHCFGERHAELYRRGRTWAVTDIYQAGLAECYIDILARFQVRGNLVVPLLKGDELWGLFCIHQCSGPREWQTTEIEFAKQIAAQLNVAIQQGEFIEQLQQKSAQLAAAAQQDKAAKEQLQQEVIQLLLAVRPALKGDLTVRAPVTDTQVGTIADAYNNTLRSLRQIVMQMQIASSQVTQISQTSDASIVSLAAQAQHQLQTLKQLLQQVQVVTHSTKAVEVNAQQVEAAIQQTNQVVRLGDTAIDRTVDEMQHIRETVAETNKRLKRLSESSQKISKVVNLIGNFTTQTQLLALNASIEATRAGEYGRGFIVVADEVRSLARQSADAATEIEEFVQEIQSNTAEVSIAMELGIQQVASGTTVVTEARRNLSAIIEATAQISQFVTGITQATQEQIQEFQLMQQTMSEVAAIADKTSEDSTTMSKSFKDLLTMAEDLQLRANQFKVE
ncbi:MAG TPA: GAF domain-containing protein [Coleofasciculaceae cyanobacterium]